MKKTTLEIAVVFLGAILAALSLSGHAIGAENTRQENPAPRLTNPLLRHVRFREIRPFKDAISKTIDQAIKSGEVEEAAVYFRSLSDGMWFGISEQESFAPASILKIPIMVTYYKLAERDPAILQKKLRYILDSQEELGETVTARSAVPGEDYTIEQLIHFMITESDNSAGTLLTNNLPKRYFIETFSDFGINLEGKDTFTALKIVASMLRVLYNASYLNEDFSERALKHLSESSFADGIRAGVPSAYSVAHKFGTRALEANGQKQLHEVAIVYYPTNPYLLAVMTKGAGDDYSKLAKLIREISTLTFREVSSQGAKSGGEKVIVD
jgi:beta-lactamase class A